MVISPPPQLQTVWERVVGLILPAVRAGPQTNQRDSQRGLHLRMCYRSGPGDRGIWKLFCGCFCSSGYTPNRAQIQCMPNQRAYQVADGTGEGNMGFDDGRLWHMKTPEQKGGVLPFHKLGRPLEASFDRDASVGVGIKKRYAEIRKAVDFGTHVLAHTGYLGGTSPSHGAHKAKANGSSCFRSGAGTRTQTQCTGTNIPNGDKIACEASVCPIHFILVPQLAGYTTADFCVAPQV